MKRVLIVLMALACVFSLVACGEGEALTLEKLSENVKNANPASVESFIDVTLADGTVLSSTAKSGSLVVEYCPTFGIDDKGNVTIPDSFSKEATAQAGATKTVTLADLTFDANYFKDGAFVLEAEKFEAVVTNIEGFFGTAITGVTEARVEISLADAKPASLAISYATANGNSVKIDISVKY